MTYQTLYNSVLSTIKSACYNVSRYGSLPAQLKAGWSTTQTNARARLTMTVANPIGQVSTSTVDSQFSSFIKTTYGINLSATVDQRGMITFFQAVALFCTAKVKVCSSQYNTGRYIVYDQNGSVSKVPVPSGLTISHDDANNICETVLGYIIANSNSMFVRYNASIALV